MNKRRYVVARQSDIEPDSMEIEASRLRVNDDHVETIAVTGYPREVHVGWLEPLLSANASIDIALHVEPVPAFVAAERLQKQLARLESSRRLASDRGRLNDPTIDVAASDAQELATRIARGESNLFRVGIAVTIRARSAGLLQSETSRIKTILAGLLVNTRPATFRQFEGWISTLPLGLDQLGVKRTFDTQALAATFPFVASGFSEPNGVLYGKSMHGSDLVFWDRFAQDNQNSVILARSGSGKSYLAKLELLRSLYRSVEVIVVDPEDEYRKLCEAVDGTYVHLGHPGVGLDPFALGSSHDALTESALFAHSFIALLVGGAIEAKTKATLDRAIVSAYAKRGISSDARTHNRRTPTLVDLDQALRNEGDDGAQLAEQLAPYVSGTYRHLFTNSDPSVTSRHMTVYSLRDVPEELKGAVTMVALNHIWRTVSDRSQLRRRLVVVDEAWLVMRDKIGAQFLFRLAKSARKYWCGLTVVTQDAADLLGTELGQAIVANAATQILLRQSPQSIERLGDAFRLSDGEKSFLLTADKGQGIIAAGRQRVAFQALASDAEHQLINTNPAESWAVAS